MQYDAYDLGKKFSVRLSLQLLVDIFLISQKYSFVLPVNM